MRVITLDEVKYAARQLDPTRVNPTEGGGCRYTDPVNDRHCVAGEILTLLGVPVPTEEDGRANTRRVESIDFTDWALEHGYSMERSAQQALGSAQFKADQDVDGASKWGTVLKEVGLLGE